MKKLLNLRNNELSVAHYLQVLLILVLLLLIFYSNTLSNGYSLDDEHIYTKNELVVRDATLSEIFTENSFNYGNFTYGYRPVAILSFVLEYKLFGLNPTVSHLINMVFYLFACFLLFYLLKVLLPLKPLKLTLLSAILFLALPVHTEIVNNIKCRDELLMLCFGLLSLIFWLKSSKRFLYLFPFLVSIFLSILSKKTGFLFLAMLPLVSYFRLGGNWKSAAKGALVFIIAAFGIRLLSRNTKVAKGDREYSFIENPLFDADYSTNKLSIVLESINFYFKKLLFPLDFVSYYGLDTIPIQKVSFESIITITFLAACMILSLWGVYKRKIYAFGGFIFLGGLLAVSNLIFPMVGIVAERFITIASIGLIIFLVFGVYEVFYNYKSEWLKYGGVLTLVYMLIYLPQIRARNSEWFSLRTLVIADVKKEPNSIGLLKLAAVSEFQSAVESKSLRERTVLARNALGYYNRALKKYPSKEIYNEKASLLYKLFGNKKEAEKAWLKALELDPKYYIAMENIGILYDDLGEIEKSIKYIKKTLSAVPSKTNLYSRLSKQLANQGNMREAHKWLDYGILENGDNYELYFNKGNVYLKAKDFKKALSWYQKAYKIQPNAALAKRIILLKKNLEN